MVADAIFCLSRSLSRNARSAASHPSLRKPISGRVSWDFSGVSWGLAFNLNNSFVFLNIVANSPFSALFVRGSAHRWYIASMMSQSFSAIAHKISLNVGRSDILSISRFATVAA